MDCSVQSDLLHVQVALTGIRRRRGVEGLPETDAETKAALVSELLCLKDDCGEILRRCAVTLGFRNQSLRPNLGLYPKPPGCCCLSADAVSEHDSLLLTSCAAGLAAPCPP